MDTEEMKDLIFEYLDDCCDNAGWRLWDEYDVERGDIETLRMKICDDSVGNMCYYCVNSEAGGLDEDDCWETIRYDHERLDEMDDKTIALNLIHGNWNVLANIIYDSYFWEVKDDAVDEYLQEHGYYGDNNNVEIESEIEDVEIEDEDYDEGFNDIEESLKKKGWR